ncbi:MAG: phosphate ABC transporter, permease protein PstA, partial [Chloroflexi bacterium]|nr:phosphate ABC transporter, permease protein PstA [Chloroflexota bacterium]
MAAQPVRRSAYPVRRGVNLVGNTLATLCVVMTIIPLAAMLYYVLAQGGSSLDLNFFTQLPAPAGETGGGFSNAIAGTLLLIPL